MSLTYVGSVPLTELAVPLFALYASVLFELSLQLTAMLSLSLSLGVSIALPGIELALSIAAELTAQFNAALSFSLPSFALNLSVSVNFELGLVLGLLAAVEALLAIDADLCVYAWLGSGSGLGSSLTSELASAWVDGSTTDADTTAYVFVATVSGPYSSDQIESLGVVAAPSAPPTPQHPPPPSGAYPPPQSYERGLAGVIVSAPPAGGVRATGTVTTDDSISTGVGAVTGVTIVDHGSGYTSAPTVSVTDTVDIVSATSATPIVVTLPHPLSIPVGHGFGVTVASVIGATVISSATPTSPIVVTVTSTAGIATCSISPGTYGLQGLVGVWFVRAMSSTTAELWSDAAYTVPSAGLGVYLVSSARLAANICGGRCAKVVSPTTLELYADQAMIIPIVGVGAYAGGTLTGAGAGAAAQATMGGGAKTALRGLLAGLAWPAAPETLAGSVVGLQATLSAAYALVAGLETDLSVRASLLGSIKAGAAIVPPSISASIELLAQIAANLKANLAVQLPNLSVALAASLTAQVNAVADLVAGIGFFLGLGSAKLEIYEYTGPGTGLGPAIASGPGSTGWQDGTPASLPIVAAVFGLTTPAAQAAFSAFFPGAS